VEELVRTVQQNPALIRLADRSDNPMKPANRAYSLSIHTGDVFLAGPNAHLAFTLQGTGGTASVTLDAHFVFRMERDARNYVTLYSLDLGELQTITVQSEN
jgi:hypothetical protein